ncbi:MAG: glutamate racemase [Candidatus Levyibacteriota bacterium]
MNNPIGIIDSGVGGLSITSKLIEKLPNESFIYLADSKNCPYGNKSAKQIYDLTKKMVDFLLWKDIKLLIVACNTITVTSIEKLRKNYPKLPIIGIVPVIKTAVEKTKNNKIGIFSTTVTADSQYQRSLIDKFAKGYKVVNIGSGDLVPLIEKLDFEAIDKVLKQELAIFKTAKIDVLVLGCSHFPLIQAQIQKELANVLILDSAIAVSHQVGRILEHNNIVSSSANPSYTFYTTGDLKSMSHFVNKLTTKGKVERISIQ